MAGISERMVMAVDSSDATKLGEVADLLNDLSAEYNDCIQAYIAAENQVLN